jgi:thiol-disulfide isomerase/thioredoxin/sugar lactone lactonase YvrE
MSSRRLSARVVPLLLAASVIGAIFALQSSCAMAQDDDRSDSPFRQRVRAPALPEGLTWLNTSGPLELNDLRGKFVLLDFWTYCCINCMHILPELEKLEEAYPKNLVVIGVHSAKFDTEKDTKNISEAIVRYRIKHPVVNDANHTLWTRFGVRAWPTLVLIDPEGFAVWGNSGETTFEVLDKLLKKSLPYYRKKGLLDETPVRFDLEAYRTERTALRFPGKVLADEPGGRLFIADSGHNRIVIARLDGTLVDIVGSGEAGRADGDYAKAQFNDPQGMALDGNSLFVADTLNHMIRKIDLAGKRVVTIAGTGQQNRDRPTLRMGNPRNTALNSPWDLWIHDKTLYIAMAGPHQIWRMPLKASGIGPYAGNGREDIVDGPLLPREPYGLGAASFAQPSGLASDGTWLYVADSEGSSIRAVPFNVRQEVKTVVGTSHLPGARLFTFGDVDGQRHEVRLQHPLGVVFYQNALYVADTYNNKIKVIDPRSGVTKTIAGTGRPGASDDPAEFDEPAGITAAEGKLFVADTNNHQIRVVDLAAANRVTTLPLAGLTPPEPPASSSAPGLAAGARQEKLQAAAVRPEDGSIRLEVTLALPSGYKINTLAPMSYSVKAAGGSASTGPVQLAALEKSTRLEKPAARFTIRLPVQSDTGEQTLEVGLVYYYCREGAEGLCKVGSVVWTVPIRLSADAEASAVPLRHQVGNE